MENKKLSSVEFYKKQVVELAVLMQHQKIDLYEFLVGLGDFGIQAKKMHKNEIMDAREDGFLDTYLDDEMNHYKSISDEQYYNETYKNQEDGKV